MSLTGKVGSASPIIGASILPQTSEDMFATLPLVGLSLLLIIISFSSYNYYLEKKLSETKFKGD